MQSRARLRQFNAIKRNEKMFLHKISLTVCLMTREQEAQKLKKLFLGTIFNLLII